MKFSVHKITDEITLKKAFRIREEVFVKEQCVDPDEEYDGFENESAQFLAYQGQQEVGTARWRFTENGIKLERFAVLKPFRGKGVGQALVKAVLADIQSHPESAGKTVYLHGQLTAMGLYEKFGFQKVGDLFVECGIDHYQMELSIDRDVRTT
ncbi:GNAT family N-acetyltransferase [Cyclobacterium roseum]|uniref:GNAT family N-acetyltransferase n=1 Tax=Cyclobacterium roseum TaxID=2666137 RepID=UPI001391C79D|nr:GNAT family N-acetyltransferase [Cyclobacterium roseum]